MSLKSKQGLEHAVRNLIEGATLTIEVLAVLVILAAIVVAALPRLARLRPSVEADDAFSGYKQRMGRGLLLGLELLLAADIISTVAQEPTIQSLGALGLLAVIRTFLSWSLDVEIDGCWPWQARAMKRGVDDTTTRTEKI